MGFRILRFTNGFILGTVGLLALTGVYGLFWTFPAWMFETHRLAGWLLIAAIPWKVTISLRSLKRGLRADFQRGVLVIVALALTVLTLLVLALGLAWGFRFGPELLWLRQTAISWHWMLALALIAPFALHAWFRWPKPRKADYLSRRGALQLLGLGLGGATLWWLARQIGELRAEADAPVRHTGSRLDGRFSGNRFPVTHTRAASPEQVDLSHWTLILLAQAGAPRSYTYAQLLALPATEAVATLDCTQGWYTVQSWRGVALPDLLVESGPPSQAQAVKFESVTGYSQLLPMAEASQVILATHVGGEPLDHSHGFPVRAVAPARRGWFWVKWLKRIEVIAL